MIRFILFRTAMREGGNPINLRGDYLCISLKMPLFFFATKANLVVDNAQHSSFNSNISADTHLNQLLSNIPFDAALGSYLTMNTRVSND